MNVPLAIWFSGVVVIPLFIAAAILGILGILLWLGARERRTFLFVQDDDLGNLKLFKTHWEGADSRLFGRQAISVSGAGQQGPTATQKAAFNFVKTNADELSNLALAAVKTATPNLHSNDLRLAAVFLHKEPNSFELSLVSESRAAAVPEGVTVSFIGKQIDHVEIVH